MAPPVSMYRSHGQLAFQLPEVETYCAKFGLHGALSNCWQNLSSLVFQPHLPFCLSLGVARAKMLVSATSSRSSSTLMLANCTSAHETPPIPPTMREAPATMREAPDCKREQKRQNDVRTMAAANHPGAEHRQALCSLLRSKQTSVRDVRDARALDSIQGVKKLAAAPHWMSKAAQVTCVKVSHLAFVWISNFEYLPPIPTFSSRSLPIVWSHFIPS